MTVAYKLFVTRQARTRGLLVDRKYSNLRSCLLAFNQRMIIFYNQVIMHFSELKWSKFGPEVKAQRRFLAYISCNPIILIKISFFS